ncbi:MAG: DUF4340 domain-containing protein [Bacteroidales bacterium]|nr:DUF4340 domain-containing protein [Bacteroidales bacterium]
MKKKKLLLLLAGIVIAACLCLVIVKAVSRSNGGLKADMFAVKDTASITKVFIADMNGESSLLTRKDGVWYVQDSIKAQPYKVADLLSTISNVELQQTVAKSAQSNINKMMSVNAIKVEVYQTAPKFTLFKKPFFVKERLVKTYYMGPATMDNMANFAILEGYDEPCIVHIPGFRGFLTPSYSFRPEEWFNCDLFSTKITRIQSLTVTDYEHPENSFSVEKAGARFFNLFDGQHQQIMHYDTVKLLDMLAEYRDLNYERLMLDVPKSEIDSTLQNCRFKTIVLKDVNGQETRLDMYRKYVPEDTYLDAIVGPIQEEVNLPYNRDKFYAILNGNTDNFLQCQYFHFDRQNQPLSYFLPRQ